MSIEKLAFFFPAGTEVDVWLREGDTIERIFAGKVEELRSFGGYQVVRIEALGIDAIDVTVW